MSYYILITSLIHPYYIFITSKEEHRMIVRDADRLHAAYLKGRQHNSVVNHFTGKAMNLLIGRKEHGFA